VHCDAAVAAATAYREAEPGQWRSHQKGMAMFCRPFTKARIRYFAAPRSSPAKPVQPTRFTASLSDFQAAKSPTERTAPHSDLAAS